MKKSKIKHIPMKAIRANNPVMARDVKRSVRCNAIILRLLRKNERQTTRRWKPRKGQTYFLINGKGFISTTVWDPARSICQRRYEYGNCFKTCKLAEKAKKKVMKVFYALNSL